MRTYHNARSAVRRLALARLISVTGGAAAFAALNFTIYEQTRSAAWLSASLLLTFGVSGLFAPIGGVLGDRFDRKRVMIVSDLAGAACFGAMAFSQEPGWLLAAGVRRGDRRDAVLVGLGRSDPEPGGRGRPGVGERPAPGRRERRDHGRPARRRGPARGDRCRDGVRARTRSRSSLSAAIVVTVHGRFAEDRSRRRRRAPRVPRRVSCSSRATACCARSYSRGSRSCSGSGMVMVADVPLAELFGVGRDRLRADDRRVGRRVGDRLARRPTAHERTEARALFAGTIVIGVTTAGVALSPWFAAGARADPAVPGSPTP